MVAIHQGITKHIDGGIYGVAAYYSINDDTQHIVVATNDGVLHEIHWNSHVGPSTPLKLAQFNGLVCFSGFFTPDDDHQHVIVATNNSNVHEIYFTRPDQPGVRSPLYHLKSIIGPHIGMAGFYTPDDQLRNAVIVDKDGELHQVFFSGTQSPDAEDFPTQFDLKDIGGLAGFYSTDDNLRHIIVVLKDGQVYDVNFRSRQKTASSDFLTQFDATLVNVAAFYTPEGLHHVIALTDKGDIYDYPHNPSTTLTLDRVQLANFKNIVDMAAYYSVNDNNCHVIVATSDGNLHEIYYQVLG